MVNSPATTVQLCFLQVAKPPSIPSHDIACVPVNFSSIITQLDANPELLNLLDKYKPLFEAPTTLPPSRPLDPIDIPLNRRM